MKSCLKTLISIALAILALLFAGCSEYSGTDKEYYAGETVNLRRLDEISESLAASENVTESERVTDADGNLLVFWVDGGSVFHFDKSCRHIQGKDLHTGSEYEANDKGLERVCMTCGGK